MRIYTLKKRLVGITSQTLKTQNLPASRSGGFSAARPAGAYAFRDGCDGRDDVFNTATLVLAVTAVTVVTPRAKSLRA